MGTRRLKNVMSLKAPSLNLRLNAHEYVAWYRKTFLDHSVKIISVEKCLYKEAFPTKPFWATFFTPQYLNYTDKSVKFLLEVAEFTY